MSNKNIYTDTDNAATQENVKVTKIIGIGRFICRAII